MAHPIAEIDNGPPKDPAVSVEQWFSSVVPGSAATTLLGDLLEVLILYPHLDQLNKKFWGWGPKILMNQLPIKG
uniref:Uncharacterized protein n=1 Tax=Macaca fascicularis TaxID=9541 RepID=Q8HXG1_MACFA|nr:hypothetical protein [Macaca fascicularis]